MHIEKLKKSKLNLHNPIVFFVFLVALLLVLSVIFHFVSNGRFLTGSNLSVIVSRGISHLIAWGLCFLFACGYTDMSVGGVVVLSSFASCVFGNWFGYPELFLEGW